MKRGFAVKCYFGDKLCVFSMVFNVNPIYR